MVGSYPYDRAARRIHLDFHTPDFVKRVGHEFDGREFIRTLSEAHVDSVTAVFGLCACGNAYWDTEMDDVRHPGLEKDLVQELLEASKGSGVTPFIHFSMAINSRAAWRRPDWAMTRRDGSRLDGGVEKGLAWTCLNSPYVDELAHPLLREFLERYRPAGIFLDMVTFPGGACFCEHCMSLMKERGVDPYDAEEHETFNRECVDRFMRKTYALCKEVAPEVAFTCNNQANLGMLRKRKEWLDYVELEAPVSWNSWMYPVQSRYVRTVDIPADGMTTRFLNSWGYFGTLNPEKQLEYEVSTVLATTGAVCIGDHLHPSGRTQTAVYHAIGQAYAYAKARQPWCLGAESVPYIAVLGDENTNHRIDQRPAGAGKMLLEGNRQFDVLDGDADFTPYKALILAENERLAGETIDRLTKYVDEGGKLVVIGPSSWIIPGFQEAFESRAGVAYQGFGRFKGGQYLDVPPASPLGKGLASLPHRVGGAFAELRADGAQVLAGVIEPYEGWDTPPRFGHFHAPPGERGQGCGVTIHRAGKGAVACVAAPVATDYFKTGNPYLRKLVLNLLDLLIPEEERLIEVDAGTPAVEVSLNRQVGRWILHLVQFTANRSSGATIIEEMPVRHGISIRVRLPFQPSRVYRAPHESPVEFQRNGNSVSIRLDALGIHEILVFEEARS